MSRYTPKLRTQAAGGGPARPKKKTSAGSKASGSKPGKKTAKPGAFACPVCQKRFNTEEALATHAADAHGTPIDPAKMTPLAANMARCPICGAPVRKRNLAKHLEFIHQELPPAKRHPQRDDEPDA